MDNIKEKTEVDKSFLGDYTDKVKKIIAALPQKPLAVVVTYGCQQNEADSERIAGMLSEMGYEATASVEEASLIVVNTCAVREHAEMKTLSVTGGYKHLKEKTPSLLIGLCGCMVSQETRAEQIKKSYPYVDFVFGTENLPKLPQIIYEKLSTGKRVFRPNTGDVSVCEGIPVRRESGYKAWLSVMYGCNNFCTYCIVPYVRGRERSRRPENIIAEARELVESGYKEITLLGQNVNSYGRGLEPKIDFPTLLESIAAIEGDYIVRFMTSHPKDATRRLVDVMASSPHIAHQFHLPVQSGSNRLLGIMNRRYDIEHYKSLVEYMREKIPDISISTDIIVGFPGETEEDFEDTLSLIKDVGFDMLFTFIYSRRKGTPAAEMENQVPEQIKSERFKRLLETQNPIAYEKNKTLVGKTLRVLCEGESKSDAGIITARTSGNKIVHIRPENEITPENYSGKYANVEITEAQTFLLWGKIVK